MPSPSVRPAPRTRAAQRASWQQILAEWQQGGEPIVDFCARRGLAPKTFYRWRRRLAADGGGIRPAASAPAVGVFQPLPLAPAHEIEVLFAHGARVRLSGASAARMLDQLIEQLAC